MIVMLESRRRMINISDRTFDKPVPEEYSNILLSFYIGEDVRVYRLPMVSTY